MSEYANVKDRGKLIALVFSNQTLGISAASGKLGAVITTYLFPLLLHPLGIKDILIMLAVVSIIGALLTALSVPESKGKT